MPISPTLINKGNSIILYTSKTRMSLADNSVPLYEITVKGKSFFIESRDVKGLDVATMVLNDVPYEFLLQPAAGHEPAILLNPRKLKVDADPTDVSRYFVQETGTPETPEPKDPKNNLPPQFRNYETHKLVSEAIKPLSQSLDQAIGKQNGEVQTALAAISINIEKQRQELEDTIHKDFVKISESQKTAFKNGWNQVTEATNKKITEWFANYRERTKKEISAELINFSTNLIKESIDTQREILRNESNTQLTSLSASTFRWIREQIHNISDNTEQYLLEKNEQIADTLDDKVSRITEQVNQQFKNLETQVRDESDKIEENLCSKVNTKVSHFDTLSISLEKIIKETPDRINDLFDEASKDWEKKIAEATSGSEEGLKKHVGLVAKIDVLGEKVKETNKELENQKKSINKEVKSYIDTQVKEIKSLALKLANSGGGGGSVAAQYANGGTMNGNLNVTGQYLSGGVDLLSIFSSVTGGGGGSGGNPAVNALVISTSANWNTAYNYSTVYSSNSSNIILNSITTSVSATTLGNNSFYVFSGISNTTWLLPSLNTTIGRTYFIKNRSAVGYLTLSAVGANNLYYTSVTPTMNILPGESYIIANDGIYWEVM